MRPLLLSFATLALASCANSSTVERKPVPPQGSDESSIPWNRPGQGEGAGMLGAMMEGR